MVSTKALTIPILLASANAALLPRDMITIVGYDGNNPNSVTAFTTAVVSYTPATTSMPPTTVSMSPATVTMSPTTVNMTVMSSTTVTMMSSTTVNTTMMLPTTITMSPTTVTMSPTTSTLTTATLTNGTTSSITSTVTMAKRARNTGAYDNDNEGGYSSLASTFTGFLPPPFIINWSSKERSSNAESAGGFPKHSSTKAYDVEATDVYSRKETGFVYPTTTATQSGHQTSPQATSSGKGWNVIQPDETYDVDVDEVKSIVGGHEFPTRPSLQARDVVSVIVYEGTSGNVLSIVTTTSIDSGVASFTTTATDTVYLIPAPSTITATTTATTTAPGSVSMSTTTARTTAIVTASGPVSMSTITVTTPRMTTYTTSTTATVAATNDEQMLYTYSTVLPYQKAILAKNNAGSQLQAIGGLLVAIGTLVLAFVL